MDTIQLNIKANPSSENSGKLFSWILRPILHHKIKVNPSAEFQGFLTSICVAVVTQLVLIFNLI